jgi:dTDP-4-amino-4,6-dideoxygalactose transaminase
MDKIIPIVKDYNMKLVEDAAHAFPLAGGYNRDSVVCFSFYATKTITTGEGGMVLCRDGETAKKVGSLRSHGIDRNTFSRYTDKKASWYYEVIAPGYKDNLPDLLAALGRVQLRKAKQLCQKRTAIAKCYNEAFSRSPYLTIPPWPTAVKDGEFACAWHLYPLRLNLEALRIDRAAFIEKLQDAGIGISVHFIPLHTMPYYRERYHLEAAMFPNTMDAYKREISLPIWPDMTESQVERVVEAVLGIAKECSK